MFFYNFLVSLFLFHYWLHYVGDFGVFGLLAFIWVVAIAFECLWKEDDKEFMFM